MKNPTKEFLSTFLSYDPDTGIITRIGHNPLNKKKTLEKYLGKPTGVLGKHGYIHIRIGDHWHKAHRLAFVFMGMPVPECVDHVDMNRKNNAWTNLRGCDTSHNMANRGASTRSLSGVKGVFPHKPSGRWRAQIMVMYKTVSLGYFDTLEAGQRAYEEASRRYFGEFTHNPELCAKGKE